MKVTFVSPDETRTDVDAADGDSVKQLAMDNGIDGIVAECGGSMMCATCHVYVDQAWQDKVGTAPADEADMLGFAVCEVTDASRLSCQIKITPELDGLVVHLPESQV